ncbi:MAG TPA: polyprenol monophosphomannose synthase [Chitinivibrionales bacterium]|jgi:dolichol-phosphate mannosyltransferase|nr:polyprenol monophosphomannose synthase [Chitinivibrionales bacterium]
MSYENVLVIIPTYNERENIGLIIPEIRSLLPDVHILVVDDNSPDGTSPYVKELAAKHPGLFVLDRPAKEGLGKAYVAGFAWALERSYEFIFEMDADFSHDPKYLPDFLTAIRDNDLVIGSRYIRGVNVVNWPMSRLLLSYFGNLFARIVTGVPVLDCTAGFKCFRRKVLETIRLDKIDSSGYSFQVEVNYLVWRNKFRIAEIPIVFTDRKRGASKMSTKIVREALVLIWKLRLLSAFNRM